MTESTGRQRGKGATELVLRTVEQLLEMLSACERGARCPSEMEVAVRCGVSRTTVREGYGQLEEKGLIERRGGGRYLLRKPRAADRRGRRPVELSKEEWVARVLMERVGSGDIIPGQRVSERTIAKELGCSLAPVREALLSLVPLGIFRKEKRRQWQAVRLTARQCVELTEFRKLIEGHCLHKLLKEAWHVRYRDELETILEESRQLLAEARIEREVFLAVDVAFHTRLLESSGNGLLAERSRFIYALIDFQFGPRHFSEERARSGIMQHVAILEAIRVNDGKRAEEMLMEHLDAACSNLLRLADGPGSK